MLWRAPCKPATLKGHPPKIFENEMEMKHNIVPSSLFTPSCQLIHNLAPNSSFQVNYMIQHKITLLRNLVRIQAQKQHQNSTGKISLINTKFSCGSCTSQSEKLLS